MSYEKHLSLFITHTASTVRFFICSILTCLLKHAVRKTGLNICSFATHFNKQSLENGYPCSRESSAKLKLPDFLPSKKFHSPFGTISEFKCWAYLSEEVVFITASNRRISAWRSLVLLLQQQSPKGIAWSCRNAWHLMAILLPWGSKSTIH